MLSKRQKNELFSLIESSKLNVSEFKFHENTEIRITHIPSEYYIRFIPIEVSVSGIKTDAIQILVIPDNSKSLIRHKRERHRGNQKEWVAVVQTFAIWLNTIKEELHTPDLWAEAAKTAQLFTGTAEASDDKFTRTELAEVQGQLRQLQQSFVASALPEAARQKLIELTETAAVKAEGLTKKDWQNWIIGGFISAITGLMLNPTQAQEVLKLVKAAFGSLFFRNFNIRHQFYDLRTGRYIILLDANRILFNFYSTSTSSAYSGKWSEPTLGRRLTSTTRNSLVTNKWSKGQRMGTNWRRRY